MADPIFVRQQNQNTTMGGGEEGGVSGRRMSTEAGSEKVERAAFEQTREPEGGQPSAPRWFQAAAEGRAPVLTVQPSAPAFVLP